MNLCLAIKAEYFQLKGTETKLNGGNEQAGV